MQFQPPLQPDLPSQPELDQQYPQWQPQQPLLYPPQEGTGYSQWQPPLQPLPTQPQWQQWPMQPYYFPQQPQYPQQEPLYPQQPFSPHFPPGSQMQWQQLPMFQPPMQPIPPLRKHHTTRNIVIGCSSALLLVVLIGFLISTASSSHNVSSSSASSTTPAAQIGGQIVVGGTEDAFIAKFGNPTSQNTNSNGVIDQFYDTNNSNIGQFVVTIAPNSRIVYGIIIESPSSQAWDSTTATSICVTYLPDDAKLDQPQHVTDSSGNTTGLYQGGYSAELANSLGPGMFRDASGINVVKIGTFSVKYIYTDNSGNNSNFCTIKLGQQ